MDTNGNVFVADTSNATIRKITPAGVVTTLSGRAGYPGSADGTGNAAYFNGPSGISVDSAGNLYVGDTYSGTIRKITPGGAVTTLAGLAYSQGSADGAGDAARFNAPAGVAADAAGSLYVADSENCTIRKVTPGGGVTTLAGLAATGSADGTGSAAQFLQPSNVAVDGAGSVYVSDRGNSTIRKITPIGTNWAVSTIAGLAGSTRNADGTNGEARFSNPSGVAVDTNGIVYVADKINCTIRKLTPIGTDWIVTTIAGRAGIPGELDGTNGNAHFDSPQGPAVDAAGRIHVADWGGNRVRMITPSGTNWVVRTIASLNQPSGVAVDSANNLFVTEQGSHVIRKISPVGTNWVVTTIAGMAGVPGSADGTNGSAQFNSPGGLAVDTVGNVFVADLNTDTIRKVAPVGTNWVVTTIGGVAGRAGSLDGKGSAARFWWPNGIAVDALGNLLVADFFNNKIRRGRPIELPSLNLLGDRGPAVISWQTSATNFVLESTSGLGPESNWVPVTNQPVLIGDQVTVTLDTTGQIQFYRLRMQ